MRRVPYLAWHGTRVANGYILNVATARREVLLDAQVSDPGVSEPVPDFTHSKSHPLNSERVPDAPGCTLHRFKSSNRRKWHYECAAAFVNGDLAVI